MPRFNDLLWSFVASGLVAAGIVGDPSAPVASRPLASSIVVQGADVVWISPGPVVVAEGEFLHPGWVGHADDSGLVRFVVHPATDYTVTARLGDPLTTDAQVWTFQLPVTRDHRIEVSVRDRIDAQARFQAEGANFQDFIRWQAVINAE